MRRVGERKTRKGLNEYVGRPGDAGPVFPVWAAPLPTFTCNINRPAWWRLLPQRWREAFRKRIKWPRCNLLSSSQWHKHWQIRNTATLMIYFAALVFLHKANMLPWSLSRNVKRSAYWLTLCDMRRARPAVYSLGPAVFYVENDKGATPHEIRLLLLFLICLSDL